MNDETEKLLLSLLDTQCQSAAAEATAAAAAAAMAAQRPEGTSENGISSLAAAEVSLAAAASSRPSRSSNAGGPQQRDSDSGGAKPFSGATSGVSGRKPGLQEASSRQGGWAPRRQAPASSDGAPKPASPAAPRTQSVLPAGSPQSSTPAPQEREGVPRQLPGASSSSSTPLPDDSAPRRRPVPGPATSNGLTQGPEPPSRPPLPSQLPDRQAPLLAAPVRTAMRRCSNSSGLADDTAGPPSGTASPSALGGSGADRHLERPSGNTSAAWSGAAAEAAATPLPHRSPCGSAPSGAAPQEASAGAPPMPPIRTVSWRQQPQPLAASGSRAVRFSSRDDATGAPGAAGGPGAGSPQAATSPLLPAGPGAVATRLRRASDSSSQGPQPSGGQGTQTLGTAAAEPQSGKPSAGALPPARRPVPAATASEAPSPSYSGGNANPQGPITWATSPAAAALADPVPGPGSAAHVQIVQPSDATQARGSSRTTGSKPRSKPAAPYAAKGGAACALRRAGELAPLLPPGGADPALRDALARAAVQNVALLATGALLPETDFGYARVLEQRQKREQQQQQQQPPPAEPAEAPARSSPAEAVSVASVQGRRDGASSEPPSPPPGSHPQRAALAPLSGRSMRSVLKSSLPGAAAGQLTPASSGEPPQPGAGDAARPPAGPPHPAPALRKASSQRSLPLRRPSSLGSTESALPGTDPESLLVTPRSTMPGMATAEADPGCEPVDLLSAENVEVRIHCLTFNMGGLAPTAAALPESLFSGSYLSPDSIADAAHIYVFATQESGPLAEWESAVTAHLGRRYTRVATESLMSIHIVMFAVKALAPYIAEVRTSSVATGVGNVLGNKGGVAVTFGLLGAQVLLVGAHFAAHDQNVERRNADFHRVCAGLFAPPTSAGSGASGSSIPPPPPQQQQQPPGDKSVRGGAEGARLSPPTDPESALAQGRNGAAIRRAANVATGPSLTRFNRGNTATCASNDSESGGPPLRALTRTLSNSSVSSLASNVSAFPGSHAPSEAASRSRMPSFWSGVSFATAQRQSNALLAHFDVVLWMGDLNYRIAGNPEVVKFAIDSNMVEVLRANDQLLNQQKKGKVLQGFQEMPIAFAPTFKFCRGTDDYDLKRTPAWTDRVLYLVNADPLFADLKPLYYMSVPELRTSDHKPVIAGFELSISPQHAGSNQHARQKACVIS